MNTLTKDSRLFAPWRVRRVAGAKTLQRTGAAHWRKVLSWNRQTEIRFSAWQRFMACYPDVSESELERQGFIKPVRPHVRCAPVPAAFAEQVPEVWRADLLNLMRVTPYLAWE